MSNLQEMYNRKYLAEVWHPLVLSPNAWSTNRYDDVARLVRNERGKILDIGCGAGQLIVALAQTMENRFSHLVGIELSDVRIANGKNALAIRYPNLINRISLEIGNVDKPLPFEDNSFDVVICCAILEHIVNVFEMMREVARICRSGGSLILTVPNAGYIRHVKDLFFGHLPLTGIDKRDMLLWEREGWDGGHLHYFTRSSVNELLKLTRFSAETWTSDGRLAKFRRWSRLLCGNLTVRARKEK